MYVGHEEIAPRNVVDEHGYLPVPGRPMPRDPHRLANVCNVVSYDGVDIRHSLTRYVPAGGGDRAGLHGPAGVLQGSASKVDFVAVLNNSHRVSLSVSTGNSL